MLDVGPLLLVNIWARRAFQRSTSKRRPPDRDWNWRLSFCLSVCLSVLSVFICFVTCQKKQKWWEQNSKKPHTDRQVDHSSQLTTSQQAVIPSLQAVHFWTSKIKNQKSISSCWHLTQQLSSLHNTITVCCLLSPDLSDRSGRLPPGHQVVYESHNVLVRRVSEALRANINIVDHQNQSCSFLSTFAFQRFADYLCKHTYRNMNWAAACTRNTVADTWEIWDQVCGFVETMAVLDWLECQWKNKKLQALIVYPNQPAIQDTSQGLGIAIGPPPQWLQYASNFTKANSPLLWDSKWCGSGVVLWWLVPKRKAPPYQSNQKQNQTTSVDALHRPVWEWRLQLNKDWCR